MPEISAVSVYDYEGVAAFLSNFPNLPADREYWITRFRFWWDDNPAYSQNLDKGWIIRDGSRIAGFVGVVPMIFMLSGKEATVFNSTTWMVLPEYRSYSMALYGRVLAASAKTLLFNTTPSAVVEKILNMLKFKLFARDRKYTRTFYIVVNFRKFMMLKYGRVLFGNTIARISSVILRILQFIRIFRIRSARVSCVKEVAIADDHFDDLWRRTRDIYRNTNMRNAMTINWYCFGNKYFKKDLFGYYEKGRLAGYFICRKYDLSGLRAIECLDIWIDPAYKGQAVLLSLINYLRKYAFSHSLDLVRFSLFNGKMSRMLEKSGMLRSLSDKRAEYLAGASDILDMITDENSYLTGAQGDYAI